MRKKPSKKNTEITIFEEREVRRTWHDDQWYFVIEDVVLVLIASSDVKQYIQRMKQRDPELAKGWVQIVHTLSIGPADGQADGYEEKFQTKKEIKVRTPTLPKKAICRMLKVCESV